MVTPESVSVLDTSPDGPSHVYLDHAATTPMLPEAAAAMVEELAHTGNASSLHHAGRRARRVMPPPLPVLDAAPAPGLR